MLSFSSGLQLAYGMLCDFNLENLLTVVDTLREMGGHSHNIQQMLEDLRLWQSENEVSQRDLAKLLGFTSSRLNQWMTGKKRPNLDAWLQIKNFLRTHKPKSSKAKAPTNVHKEPAEEDLFPSV